MEMPLRGGLGENIENYEVLYLLGKGGFASVYKARCLRTNQMVAIKMIDKKLIQGAGMANRVRQEVEIHSRLKHPSVLELYTFFQDANYVYLVLELAHNGELHRYMKQQMGRPMAEPEAASILRQVVAGLQYLHSHRIMHRDISLSNLLLSQDMHVKIADFGLATQIQRVDEKHMTMCGTPNYISPEVVSRASHGLPADIWGLGCMFYTLLVGRPPFDTDAVQATLNKVVMSDYQLPAHMSHEACDLIDKLLQKNPNRRITLEEVLEHPFMLRYEQSNAPPKVTSATTGVGSINTNGYNQSTSSSDSGIITFASSNSSAARTPLQRSRSVEKCTAQPLAHIYEDQSYAMSQQKNTAMENYSSFNDFQSLQRHMDGMHVDCLPVPMSMPKSSAYIYKPCANAHISVDSQENHFLQPAYMQQQQMSADSTSSSSSSNINSGSAATLNRLQQKNVMLPQRNEKQVERISVPQFNTARLQPTRYKTKNAVMSILRTGEVVLEFIKYKSKFHEDRIVDVCWFSSDGLRIIIYQPDPGRGLPLKDEPPELPPNGAGADCIFSYENLPTKHWKKYVYAARFVSLVKSKTPKMTYFSVRAKCHLMESMVDFEMFFYTGAKITISSQDGLKVYDQHGLQLHDLHEAAASSLVEHQEECFKHCQAMCNALELVQTHERSCFPVVVGRRPATDAVHGQRGVAMRDNTNFAYSTPKSQEGSINFSISTLSSVRSGGNSTGHTSASRAQLLAAQQNLPIKRVDVPGVGTATELSHGVVQLQFIDGSLLAVIPDAHGGGLTYTQSSGVSTHFGPHDDLPLVVRERLAQLPHVQRQLKNAPLMGGTRLAQLTSSRSYDCCITTPKTTVVHTVHSAHNAHPMKFFR